jgi:hypothetical protein
MEIIKLELLNIVISMNTKKESRNLLHSVLMLLIH